MIAFKCDEVPARWKNKELLPTEDGRYVELYKTKKKLTRVFYRKTVCAGCGSPRFTTESNFRRSSGRAYCRLCQSIRTSGLQRKGRKYKSGSKKGYVLLYTPEHPHCDKSGYVPEHRLVVEKELGRCLRRNEFVHHIDCDKENNTLSNLFVVNKFQHNAAHSSIERCVKELLKLGVLFFDRATREYVVVEKHQC